MTKHKSTKGNKRRAPGAPPRHGTRSGAVPLPARSSAQIPTVANPIARDERYQQHHKNKAERSGIVPEPLRHSISEKHETQNMRMRLRELQAYIPDHTGE